MYRTNTLVYFLRNIILSVFFIIINEKKNQTISVSPKSIVKREEEKKGNRKWEKSIECLCISFPFVFVLSTYRIFKCFGFINVKSLLIIDIHIISRIIQLIFQRKSRAIVRTDQSIFMNFAFRFIFIFLAKQALFVYCHYSDVDNNHKNCLRSFLFFPILDHYVSVSFLLLTRIP